MTRLGITLSLASSAMLAACAPAERPRPALSQVAPPAGWTEQTGLPGDVAPDWWRLFNDPILDQLVARALANNTDVLTAVARVEESEANVRLARAAFLPTIDASGSIGRQRQLSALGMPSTSTAIQPEVQLSWQLDLFGRLKAQARAARYQYVATQADRDATALSVAGQVARAYLSLVTLDAQLKITRETLKTRETALRLAEDQARVGYSSQFELTQAQSEYEAVRGQIPELLRGIRNAENGVRLLTGDPPGASFGRTGLEAIPIPQLPNVLPSTLLTRRPDLAAAEAQLLAADASLVSARRAFLPDVALSASIGALLVNGLDYDPVTIWSVGGSILAPIFRGGALRAQVDVSNAQRDQAAYAYRAAALSAFRDVENALTDVRRYAEEIEVVKNRRRILQRSLALAIDRYRGGYASYLDQLDAQRNLYSTELEAVSIRQTQLLAVVDLAVAYGGGWSNVSIVPASGPRR